MQKTGTTPCQGNSLEANIKQGNEQKPQNVVATQKSSLSTDKQKTLCNHPPETGFKNHEKAVSPREKSEKKTATENSNKENSGIFKRLIPSSVYNPETKKILGVLNPEDLLLIALIFLFLENDDEDNLLIILALIYILLSEHIDITKILF